MHATTAQIELRDLTEPVGGVGTARQVLGLFLARTVRGFRSVPLAAIAAHNRALYQQTLAVLARADAAHSGTAIALFRMPTASAFVHCIAGQLHKGGDGAALNRWLRACCEQVLLELAIAGRLGSPVVVGPPAGQSDRLLCAPGANLAVWPTADATVQFANGQLVARAGQHETTVDLAAPRAGEYAAARVTRPYHEIVPGLWVTDCDNNPLAMVEAHPDKQGNRPDWGGRDPRQWVAALREALDLVDAHLPLLGRELRLIARVVVAVGWDAERHLSASYKEAVGTLYMTLHPQVMTMAEALVHEYQHNKINAAFHLDPLLHNAWSPLYASPVRPDPRPLHGVVLAVHAFQPVARLYEAMADAGHAFATNAAWQARFARIVQLDRAGAATVLENARPTACGAPFFAEMRRIDRHLADLEASRWGDAAVAGAHLDELAGHD
ncbi:MAG: hypothetical protein FJ100_16170 [Deltaproteobacteria bacterium]|nr:hypothetical protein [Deltaproteobacteria bacterium]